ncbi:MAG: ABC transporter permease [Candidatus Bathyarchaeia archaeon]
MGQIDAKRIAYVTMVMAHKDLLDFWKAKMLVVSFTLFPIVMMAMFGYMFPSITSANPYAGKFSSPYGRLPIAIVNEDGGRAAEEIADRFAQLASSTGLFEVKSFASLEAAKERMTEGKLKGVLVIPQGFTESLSSGRQATMTIIVDDTNPQAASSILGQASSLVRIISEGVAASRISDLGAGADPMALLEPIGLERKPFVKGSATTFQFLAPGFMALTVTLGTLSGLAATISREREQGTLDGIMVSPVPRYTVVVSKVLAQTVRGLIQSFIILAVSVLFFGVRVYGSPLLMVLTMFLAVLSFSGIGIIITSVAGEQETAMTSLMLINMPMTFLSNVVFPIEQLPWWLQAVGKSLPLYYSADALRKIIVLNAQIHHIAPDLVVLALYSLLTLSAAIPIFVRSVSR